MPGREDLLCGVAEHEHLGQELRDTRAILQDTFTEKNESWLYQLVEMRQQAYELLKRVEYYYDEDYESGVENRTCRECRGSEYHLPNCALARLLRLLGGEDERKKQQAAVLEEDFE